MFSSLFIQNFRGFKQFRLQNLETVNLITGGNDVGKTALLEAIYLLLGETNLSLVANINTFRGLGRVQGDLNAITEWLWTPIFYDFNTKMVIAVEGEWEDSHRRIELRMVQRPSAYLPSDESLKLRPPGSTNGIPLQALQLDFYDNGGRRYTSQMVVDDNGITLNPVPLQPSFPGYYLAARMGFPLEEDARFYGQLEISRIPYELIEVLKVVEPRLQRITTVLSPGGAMLYGDLGLSKLLPLALMGDGLNRLTSILLRIAISRGGVVLVDEIENGIHYSMMEHVWEAIARAARLFDVQIFATTHSFECIQAAHRTFVNNDVYDLRLHRLDRINGEVQAVNYDQEMLETVMQTDLEVR